MNRDDRATAEEAHRILEGRSLGRTRSSLRNDNLPAPSSPTSPGPPASPLIRTRSTLGNANIPPPNSPLAAQPPTSGQGRSRSRLVNGNISSPTSPISARQSTSSVRRTRSTLSNGNGLIDTSAIAMRRATLRAARSRSGRGNQDTSTPDGQAATSTLERTQSDLHNGNSGTLVGSGDAGTSTSTLEPAGSGLGDGTTSSGATIPGDSAEVPIVLDDSDVHMRSHTTTDVDEPEPRDERSSNNLPGDTHAESSRVHANYQISPESGAGDDNYNDGDDYVTAPPRNDPADDYALDDGPATFAHSTFTERNGRYYIPNFTCPQNGSRTTARFEGMRHGKVIITLTPISSGRGRPAYAIMKSELRFGAIPTATIQISEKEHLKEASGRHGPPGIVFVAPQTVLRPSSRELTRINNPQSWPVTYIKVRFRDNSTQWVTRSTWLNFMQPDGESMIQSHFNNVGQNPPIQPLRATERASLQDDGGRWRASQSPEPQQPVRAGRGRPIRGQQARTATIPTGTSMASGSLGAGNWPSPRQLSRNETFEQATARQNVRSTNSLRDSD